MDEGEARAAIVAYGRRLYERGLVAGASGNLSMRLYDGSLVVTPTLRSLGTLRPEDCVAVAPDGVAWSGSRPPTSELPLHVAAYRTRPDVRCVIHTHPTHCIGWSKTGSLFPLDTVGAIESLGSIAFTRYARSGTQELADVCAAAFAGNVDTIVMERHGLSSIASDLETAFLRTDLAEQTAHIEFVARALQAARGGVSPLDGERTNSMSTEKNQRPDVPMHEFRAAAGDRPDARAAIDDFHSEFSGDAPDHARLGAHAERLRGFADVAGPFERWWMSPSVQAFVAELGATGV